jgi:succinate dehydrogenase / fumarate reductase cytochrome b subunit
VSTAIASDHTVPLLGGRNHFLFRRLHSLTGLVFGGYLVIHLIVNSAIALGGDTYQVQVDKIHSLGAFLPFVEWTFIYLPIIFHTVYGIWIALTGQPNVNRYAYGKNWAYVGQRVSGIVIVLFILFHVLSLKYGLFGQQLSFEPHRALPTVVKHFDAGWWVVWLIYPIGITASCFHLANGVWTAAITWGLAISAHAQKRWGYVCAVLFAAVMAMGFAALVGGARMSMADAEATLQAVHGG